MLMNEQASEPRQRLQALARDMAQQLTVISHYADACDQLMQKGSDSSRQSISTWTAKIAEQVELGNSTIRQLQELADNEF